MSYNELFFLKSNFNPFRLIKTFPVREWTISPFHGLHLFAGNQGTGKTLTLVRFIKSMTNDFKDLKVLSNVDIGDIDFIEWNKPDDLIRMIKEENLRGCIIVIDEANVVFPSTDKPDKAFLEIVCMLRHYELYVCMTAQRIQRLSKFLREQLKFVTITSIPFKGFSFNKTYVVDSDSMLNVEDAGQIMSALKHIDTQFYFHHIDDYSRYDSHATINLLRKESVLNE